MSKSKNIDTNTKLTKDDMLTADVAGEKLQQLRQLFPGAFKEDKDEQGKTVERIDCERILAEVGIETDAFYTRRERYGLDWPGKVECVKLIQQPSLATLKPCPDESVEFDTTENLFIEGDNLEVLKLLQKSYFGKVKMVYIDPPYNTGNDFVYPDNFVEPLENYLELTGQKDVLGRKLSANTETAGRFHSNWLNMMFPRLYLARNLLREDGVVFISIDDNEATNLKHLCNEILGEENFVAQFVWKKSYGGGSKSKYVVILHEYVMMYAKNKEMLGELELPPNPGVLKYYKYRDEKYDLRGPYRKQPLATKSMDDRENLQYPIIWNNETIYPEKQWQWAKDRTDLALQNNELVFTKKDNGWTVDYKQYLKDENGVVRGAKPFSILEGPYTQSGTSEITDCFGNGKTFTFPKPSKLITYFLGHVDNDAIILDFFSGSATTAHAVLEMNKEDGGNRKFIMVQIPEPCDEKSEAFKAGYKNIAEIGKERIRKIINKIKDEDKKENSLFDNETKSQDLGFRVFKLDHSNFRVWDGSPGTTADLLFERMAAMTDPLRDETKPEDLLYELLLKAGFSLSTRVKKIKLAGKTVYSVENDAVLLCLENEVTKELIDEVINLEPFRFYCLDRAFKKNDQLKVNTIQQFAAYNQGREKETEIIFRTI